MSPNNLLEDPKRQRHQTPLLKKFIKSGFESLNDREVRELLLGQQQLQHDFEERRKEQGCLYGVINISRRPSITLDKLCQGVVNLLPQGWQYPEIACAKFIINDKEFTTENYKETEWKQSSDIRAYGVKIGTVEVGYLEARPESDEGPFLKEERLLINAVAERLGEITERKQAEEKQQAIAKTALDGFWITNLDGRLLEVNDSYCKMIGYTREELLKMSIPDIEAVEKPGDTIWHIKKVKEQSSDHFETRHKRKDGKIIDVEVNVNYFNDGEGQLFVFLRDITGLKQEGGSQRINSQATPGGHVTPLQGRFMKSGFAGINDQKIIELLLSFVLSRRKCKDLAKTCFEQFGSLRGLLSASPQALEQAGLPPHCICEIRLLHELPAEVLKQKIFEQPVHSSSKEVFEYLQYSMRDLEKEVFKVIYLNNRNQIIDAADLFEGTLDSIPIRPREIVESAIKHNATRLIFAHNHPAGDPAPSRSDKQLTRDLVFIGMILDIKVLDHIIIGGDKYFSFADKGLIKKYEDNFLNLKIRGVFDIGADILEKPTRVSALHRN